MEPVREIERQRGTHHDHEQKVASHAAIVPARRRSVDVREGPKPKSSPDPHIVEISPRPDTLAR
jgi:hypothetical protein